MPVPDKRVTIDDVVAEVRDGMTVGIGGWGSRRKPMALVRALLPLAGAATSRSSPTAGPTSACCAGRARCSQVVYAFVSLDSIALEPHFRNARQAGAVQHDRARRGHVPPRPAGRGVAGAVPADARRARLRRDARQPAICARCVAVRRRRGARRDARARRSTSRSSTCTAATRAATASTSTSTPTSTTSCAWPRTRRFMCGRADRRHRRLPEARARRSRCASTG